MSARDIIVGGIGFDVDCTKGTWEVFARRGPLHCRREDYPAILTVALPQPIPVAKSEKARFAKELRAVVRQAAQTDGLQRGIQIGDSAVAVSAKRVKDLPRSDRKEVVERVVEQIAKWPEKPERDDVTEEFAE